MRRSWISEGVTTGVAAGRAADQAVHSSAAQSLGMSRREIADRGEADYT